MPFDEPVPVSAGIAMPTRRLVGLQVLALAAAMVLGIGLSSFDLDGPALVFAIGAKLASAALGLTILQRLGWFDRAGFHLPRGRHRLLLLGWLPVLYLLLAAIPGYPSRSAGQIAAVALLTFAVGLDEELWFRGLILESMRWRGTTEAVIYSAVIFGLFHGVNAIGGQPLSTTAVQIGVATAWGLALGALRVRLGSIWPAIAVHALWDFLLILRTGELGESAPTGWREAAAVLLVFTPLALYGAVLARPSKVPGPDGYLPRPVPAAPSGWPALPTATQPSPTEPLGPWPAAPQQVEAVWQGRAPAGYA